MEINTIDMIYKGSTEADAVYKGSNLVWQNEVIVQEVFTVTEGEVQGVSKSGPTYGNYGYRVPYLSAYPGNAAIGSVSPGSFRGYAVNRFALWRAVSGTDTFQFHIEWDGIGANKAPANFFDRIFFEGYGWIDRTAMTYASNADWAGYESEQWSIDVGSNGGTVSTGAYGWDGTGTRQVIIEYTP